MRVVTSRCLEKRKQYIGCVFDLDCPSLVRVRIPLCTKGVVLMGDEEEVKPLPIKHPATKNLALVGCVYLCVTHQCWD